MAEASCDAAKLAERMARAFRSPLRCFIIQQGVDDVELMMRVLKDSKVMPLVTILSADRRGRILVVTVNTRPCRAECAYEKCKGVEDRVCMEDCMRKCTEERIELVARLLEEYAAKAG